VIWRIASHFISSFRATSKFIHLPKALRRKFPAMFTGKWPLREATLYAKAFRRGNQADTADLGVTNMPTVRTWARLALRL